MNRNEFNRFIAGGDIPGPGDLEGLRELTVLFPWFHSAHMLLLRGLKENADIRFDTQLKASALSVSDREVLYHYLFMQPAVEIEKEEAPQEEVPQEEITHEEDTPVEIRDEEIVQEEVAREEVTPVEIRDEAIVQEEVPQEEVTTVEIRDEEIVQEEVASGGSSPPVEIRDEEIVQEEVPQEEVATVETLLSKIPQDEVFPEESAGEAAPAPEADASATEGSAWRTREELMAEIEARLEELSSQHEEVPGIEKVVAPDTEAPVIESVVAPEAELPETESVVSPEAEVNEIKSVVSQDTEFPEIESVVSQDTEFPEIESVVSQDTEFPEIEAVVSLDVEVPEIEKAAAPDTEMPVTDTQMEQEPAGEELLELVPDNEPPVSGPEQTLTPQDLIDRFIQTSPTLERIPLAENHPVHDLSEPDMEEEGNFITETLAKIYINQGYYTRAINIYEKLSLQFPEKSAYFAGRIEKIKDLIK